MKRHPDSVTIELCNSEAESGVFIDVCVRRSVCVWGGVCVHFCSSLLCISCWVVELVDHCRRPRVLIHSPATYLRVCVCLSVCVRFKAKASTWSTNLNVRCQKKPTYWSLFPDSLCSHRRHQNGDYLGCKLPFLCSKNVIIAINPPPSLSVLALSKVVQTNDFLMKAEMSF